MKQQQFKLFLSEQSFKKKYECIDWIRKTSDTQVFTVKQKEATDGIEYIAKQYEYQQSDFINNIWDELNSIVITREQDHPNVIKYYDAFLFENSQSMIQTLIVVMEKAQSDLEKFISNSNLEEQVDEEATMKKNKKQISPKLKYENQIYDYLQQALNGFKFLKQFNIYHRDYKPQNLVLIDNKLKIIDFDVSKITFQQMQMYQTQLTVTGTPGTPLYIDPNIVNLNPVMETEDKDKYKYNIEKADIFSLGLTFLQVVKKWNSMQMRQLRTEIEFYFSKKQFNEFNQSLESHLESIEKQNLKLLLKNMIVLELDKRWGLENCLNANDTIAQQQNSIVNNENDNEDGKPNYWETPVRIRTDDKNKDKIQQEYQVQRKLQLEQMDRDQFLVEISNVIMKDSELIKIIGQSTDINIKDPTWYTIAIQQHGQKINNLCINIQEYQELGCGKQIRNFILGQKNLYKLTLCFYESIFNSVIHIQEVQDNLEFIFGDLYKSQKLFQLEIIIGQGNKINIQWDQVLGQSLNKLGQQLHKLKIYMGRLQNTDILDQQQKWSQFIDSFGQLYNLRQLEFYVGDGYWFTEEQCEKLAVKLQNLTYLEKLEIKIKSYKNFERMVEFVKRRAKLLPKLKSENTIIDISPYTYI